MEDDTVVLNCCVCITPLIVCVYDVVFICITCVWEEIGDVLHGLGEDRGCTSKPVDDYGKIGDEPRVAAHMRTYCRDIAFMLIY